MKPNRHACKRWPVMLATVFALSGCASTAVDAPAGEGDTGRFYSYVDAQGQLVTVERPSEPVTPAEQASEAELAEINPGSEGYRSSDEVDAELEARDRERFVTYVDEEGRVQRAEYDRQEAKEALAARPGPFEALDAGPGDGFVETVRQVSAACCLVPAARAGEAETGRERRVGLSLETAVMLEEQAFPGAAYRVPEGATGLTVDTFAAPGRSYLHPQALFLDNAQRPMLMVDNLFQRWFAATWYRYGYLEGAIAVPAGAAYLVLYLDYAPGGAVQPPAPGSVLDLTRAKESLPGLEGDMTLLFTDEAAGNSNPGSQSQL